MQTVETQCDSVRCVKNGTTVFVPVPDSIVLLMQSLSNVEIYVSYFQNLYYYHAYNNFFIGIVYFIFCFKSLSLKSFSIY